MATRSTKDGTVPVNSARKAATARSRSQSRSDGTDGTRPTLSKGVVHTARTTSGQKKAASGTRSVAILKRGTPGYDGPAPILGRSSAMSGTADTSYGTAAARNNSRAGSSGAVSGKSTSYGTAPAKQATPGGAYGTWEGK